MKSQQSRGVGLTPSVGEYTRALLPGAATGATLIADASHVLVLSSLDRAIADSMADLVLELFDARVLLLVCMITGLETVI